MEPVREQFDDCLKCLEDSFSQDNFVQTRKAWFHRSQGDCVQRLAFSLERKGSEEGVVRGSLGIGFRSLDEIVRQCKESAYLQEQVRVYKKYPCCHGMLLAHLFPRDRPCRWFIVPKKEMTSLAAQISSDAQAFATPYFSQFDTLEKQVHEWRKQFASGQLATETCLYLAFAEAVLGNTATGANLLRTRAEVEKQRLSTRSPPREGPSLCDELTAARQWLESRHA